MFHLRRDLLTHFDLDDSIIQGFDDINVHVEKCGQYLNLLLNKFIHNPEITFSPNVFHQGYFCET